MQLSMVILMFVLAVLALQVDQVSWVEPSALASLADCTVDHQGVKGPTDNAHFAGVARNNSAGAPSAGSAEGIKRSTEPPRVCCEAAPMPAQPAGGVKRGTDLCCCAVWCATAAHKCRTAAGQSCQVAS